PGDDTVLSAAAAAIAAVRKAKSGAGIPMRQPVPALILTAAESTRAALAAASADVRSAGKVTEIRLEPAAAVAEDGYEVVLT
ncbi:MAG TPA: hypothetical protein VEH05_03515, partial [Streptosporangiaceae bacterium]|nr:hypothetical protein [Streptosporangiaceae bacterium]